MTENQITKEIQTAQIADLLAVLPHRFPFLLVDKIIEIKGDETAIGIKNVTFNEPHFLGHFPDMPIMPGVLIIEAMAQTAGAISLLHNYAALGGKKPHQNAVVYFMTIDKAKFRKPVVPGDRLELHVKKIKARAGIAKYEAIAKVDNVIVAEAEVGARCVIESN